MSDADDLQHRILQISQRYLERTLTELRSLAALVDAVKRGEARLKDIQALAHKIHGSAAVFGFDAMSVCAGRLEHAVDGDPKLDADLLVRIEEALRELSQAVHEAAAARGLE